MYESEFITNINGKEKRKPEMFFLKTATPTPAAFGGTHAGDDVRLGARASLGLEPRPRAGWHRAPKGHRDCGWLHGVEGLQSRGQARTVAGTGAVPPRSPRLRSTPRRAGALPARWSCGFSVKSPAPFCQGYKAPVFIRCCDLRYTNPLKKHK